MTCCLTFVTAILSVVLRHQMETSAVALASSYCINLTALFQWAVRQSAETQNYMTRRIEFGIYKLKYRPELEPVLKGINLEIIPRNKIGVTGRTGAGKSSIFQALFRLTEPSTTEGKMLIDGIDIHTISLNNLRSILSIIPHFTC
ncbi:unnamed protein product [Adineta steineri]|uniref:ABC transporter domain-containing protein n=2 Tax=Adineta steineri TaxID=433720 RepID=A0A815P1L3_9BILA|nr:unnamed protein product [Adineta steineri]